MLAVGLAVGVVAVLWGIYHLHSDRSFHDDVVREANSQDADFYLKAVTYREFQREKPVWVMVAEDARLFQDKDLILLSNIQSTFHSQDGNNIALTGREGRIKLSSLDISINGDIRAISEDGTRLFAENFHWDNKERRATSTDYIRIIRENVQIEGIGFEFDPDTELLTIKKDVRTHIGNTEG